jgi:nucleoside 2-deoxyribosyltransferase
MKPKAYISGPITGRAKLNIDSFRQAETILQNTGHNPVVPHDLFDGYDDQTAITWEQYMKVDLKVLLDCDMVVTLPDWHDSKGANIEVDLARKLNIPVVSILKIAHHDKENGVSISAKIGRKQKPNNISFSQINDKRI